MHGGEFNGNQSKKLSNSISKLADISDDNKTRKVNEAMKSFKDVRKSCFGSIKQSDHLWHIKKFEDSYKDLHIPVTPKVHAVLDHIQDFLEDKEDVGLGPYSEQASESVHHDFNRLWTESSYKRSIEQPDYRKKNS